MAHALPELGPRFGVGILSGEALERRSRRSGAGVRLAGMDIVRSLLLIVHLLSWALVFGYALSALKTKEMPKGLLHGALGALLSGLLLVGVIEMGDGDVNHMKIGIKLVVALVVSGLAIWGERRDEKLSAGFFGGIAGLVVVNVAIAVLV